MEHLPTMWLQFMIHVGWYMLANIPYMEHMSCGSDDGNYGKMAFTNNTELNHSPFSLFVRENFVYNVYATCKYMISNSQFNEQDWNKRFHVDLNISTQNVFLQTHVDYTSHFGLNSTRPSSPGVPPKPHQNQSARCAPKSGRKAVTCRFYLFQTGSTISTLLVTW